MMYALSTVLNSLKEDDQGEPRGEKFGLLRDWYNDKHQQRVDNPPRRHSHLQCEVDSGGCSA